MKKDLIYVAVILLSIFVTWKLFEGSGPCSEQHAWWHIQKTMEESSEYKIRFDDAENSSDSLTFIYLNNDGGALDSGYVSFANLLDAKSWKKISKEAIGKIRGKKFLFLKEYICP